MKTISSASPPTKRQQRGFTLIEIVVAIIVMSILAIISFRGMSSMLDARDHLTAYTQKWYHLSVFFSQLESDLLQLRERKIRDRHGAVLPTFIGKPDFIARDKEDEDAQLIFVRAGVADQIGAASDMKRVGYRLHKGNVEMLLWPALDLAQETLPMVEPILTDVRAMTIRYQNSKQQWTDYWPDTRDLSQIPRGLEITIQLQSGEIIRRVFALNQGVAY